jgi:hypothetical protein
MERPRRPTRPTRATRPSRLIRPTHPLARELLLLALGAVALAATMHWPLPLHLGGHVAHDLGDPLPQAWQIAWGGHALLHQPLHVFDANQFHPYRDTLAFSDALVGYAPAGLLGSGPAAAIARYDVLYLLAYALAFAGAHLLARTLGAPPAAAVVAGAAFAFSPWRIEQSGHLHVVSSGGIPLALALLVRGYRDARRWTVLAGWAVAAWQLSLGWTLGLQLAYLLLALGPLALLAGWRPPRPTWAASAAGVVLFALVAVVLGRVYLRVADAFPDAHRSPALVAVYSGSPAEFLVASSHSLVWSGATAPLRTGMRAVAERSLFPGLAIVLLAALGAWRGAWPRRLRAGLAAGALLTAALALGFTDPGRRWLFPYGWLSELPGWSAVRTPGRLMTLTTLALALLAAAGAQLLGRRWRWAPLALTAVVLVEGSAFSLPGGRLSGPPHPAVPAAPAGLAAATPPLLELPLFPSDDRRYLLWSTAGFPPLVNGRSSTIPPSYLRLPGQVAGFPDPASVARLRMLGVRTVVLHRDRLAGTPWAGWRARPWRALGLSRELREGVVLYRIAPQRR